MICSPLPPRTLPAPLREMMTSYCPVRGCLPAQKAKFAINTIMSHKFLKLPVANWTANLNELIIVDICNI
jgi:hypothetical protein